MKKIIFFFIITFLYSCSSNISNDIQIKNNTETSEIKNNITSTWNVILNKVNWLVSSEIKSWKEACWEKTCELQKYLEKLEFEGKFDTKKADYFQKRFWIIAQRFKQKDLIVKSEEFKKFVNDFYAEYFPCIWKVEICSKKWDYSYDEQNFIWYIFLPKMIAIEFQQKNNWDDSDTESLIQAIRRTYFASFEEKEAMEQVWKDKVMEKAKKIDISTIDKKRLKTDNEYFNKIIMAPWEWIFDKIFDNILNPIPWEEKDQRLISRWIIVDLFLSKMKELWISKDYFYSKAWTSEENFRILDKKINLMIDKYWLKDKIPSDRFLRHDEIANYFFWYMDELDKKWDFKKDAVEIRHYIILQFIYPDEDLYDMSKRVSKYNSINNFMAENIVKYTKYMNNQNTTKF